MKIVVLDGYTTTGEDLNWSEFEKLGDFVYYDRTAPDEVIARAKEADIVIDNKVLLGRDVLEKLPNLKYIGLLSTGFNVVDTDYARERSIPVCNIPDYSSKSVAQLTFALILELAMGVGAHSRSVADGAWTRNEDFCYRVQDIVELDGKTLGLVGYGNIAKQVEKIAKAVGMNVIAYKRSKSQDSSANIVSLDELYANSDIISLHCPINKDSEKMINSDSIARMKDGVWIINTARGGIVDEKAVRQGLDSGKIGGYGADVLSKEPPNASNPLLGAPRCYITPHSTISKAFCRVKCKTEFVEVLSFFGAEKTQQKNIPHLNSQTEISGRV